MVQVGSGQIAHKCLSDWLKSTKNIVGPSGVESGLLGSKKSGSTDASHPIHVAKNEFKNG